MRVAKFFSALTPPCIIMIALLEHWFILSVVAGDIGLPPWEALSYPFKKSDTPPLRDYPRISKLGTY
jgi:hypothetical protein